MAPPSPLGAQVWVRPDDSTERVERLFERAAESGLGYARLFLVWPWVEPRPGEWAFDSYDAAFDAAADRDIGVKATLTANSGPWHVGTPSMLHSHTGFLDETPREAVERYVRRCARRYADHPALAQWILWNEPKGSRDAGGVRTDRQRDHWQSWLADRRDLPAVNRRWRTGFESFEEIPFPEDIPHEAHRGASWNAWAPWLADWRHRARWLNVQIGWVRDALRAVDPETETCVNPGGLFGNQAAAGRDLNGMADGVDVLGGSFHPPWHFAFAPRWWFPGLVAAGVARLRAASDRVEVTELQFGNTAVSGVVPRAVAPGELARLVLAGLAAGADSVTGWCFNARSRDWEAGEWALLDDADRHTPRSRMLARVRDSLVDTRERTGAWRPARPRAWVVADPDAQAQEWLDARGYAADATPGVPGRLADDGAQGAAALAVALMAEGAPVGMGPLADLPDPEPGDLAVASHQVAWAGGGGRRLLAFADAGGTVLLDGTSGRKDDDAALYRPWPGGLADAGLRARGLESDPGGHAVTVGGDDAGRWVLARLRAATGDDWAAWPEPRYADGEPCVFERAWGDGRIVVARGPLGPSLVHEPPAPAVRYVLGRALAADPAVRPLTPRTVAIPVDTERGRLAVVLGPDPGERDGPLRVAAGARRDLWTGAECDPEEGTLSLSAGDGVALLWTDD